MSRTAETDVWGPRAGRGFRDWFAASLGVRPERKGDIYVELARSATLRDAAYWLQILFASGIATLGLVLNSPAVIIGAMLISPLMGPILAAGLALAAGDLPLGVRAVVSLTLSCLVAVVFATLLVSLLPFREMTAEIAARTEPTTLDLVVALFSGAVGSVATCKEVKGVVTSIPGVAIAVALMPPLCVVGYGVGLSFSLSAAEGMRVARGGGLLFLTNLVAITFTAMIVFLALHIDTREVRERVAEWRKRDREHAWFQGLYERLPRLEQLLRMGGLPVRFLMILIPILAILFPLSHSFDRLQKEIAEQQRENRLKQAATELWQREFGTLPDGGPRSEIDRLSVSEKDGRLMLSMRVFTSKPCGPDEEAAFTRELAQHFQRAPETVALQLVEVPTTSAELMEKATAEKSEVPEPPPPPTIAQLRESFMGGIKGALDGLRLPPDATLLGYDVLTGGSEPLRVRLSYLGGRDIDPDAQSLIAEDVRARLEYPGAGVSIERVPSAPGQIVFRRNRSELSPADTSLLDETGRILRGQPALRLEVTVRAQKGEREDVAAERARAIVEYLTSNWQVAEDRVAVVSGEDAGLAATLALKLAGDASPT